MVTTITTATKAEKVIEFEEERNTKVEIRMTQERPKIK